MPQPNILLILTDQHRLSAVGCYGETPCRTPNIDRLAQDGVRFENTYTTFPVCSPARGTIMTGQYAHTHGISSNTRTVGASLHGIHDRPGLLSRRMRAAGYTCGYTGKWHLGDLEEDLFDVRIPQSLPSDVGFIGQDFPGHGAGGFQFEAYQTYLKENGWQHQLKYEKPLVQGNMYGVLQGPTESTMPYFLTNHTLDLIDQCEEPFFIWHNFWGPHAPYFVPQEYYNRYKDVEIPEWPNYRWDSRGISGPHQVKIQPDHETNDWDFWAEIIRHYYAFATLIDDQIGRMIDHLTKTGKLDNTIIMFAADHGETLGSHGGLTDKGWHFFEEIQRIPFIVRSPHGKRGLVREDFISLADFYPTILDYAGIESQECHGQSVRPLIEGRPIAWRDSVVTEFLGLGGLSATMISIRKGNIKYGWNASGRDELYDLHADPFEMENRIASDDYQSTLAEMRITLGEWMVETNYKGLDMYCQSRQVTLDRQ